MSRKIARLLRSAGYLLRGQKALGKGSSGMRGHNRCIAGILDLALGDPPWQERPPEFDAAREVLIEVAAMVYPKWTVGSTGAWEIGPWNDLPEIELRHARGLFDWAIFLIKNPTVRQGFTAKLAQERKRYDAEQRAAFEKLLHKHGLDSNPTEEP